MLDDYYSDERTLRRIRSSWLAAPIERYVGWLAERGYATSSVRRRVPILVCFGHFARERGALTPDDLPNLVDGFVEHWARSSPSRGGTVPDGRHAAKSARVPVEQMLSLVVPGFSRSPSEPRPLPFVQTAPRFFDHLREGRGLREASVQLYAHNLRTFEAYLSSIGSDCPSDLSPSILSCFTIESGKTRGKGAMATLCSHVRVFLSYLYRQGSVSRDLSACVDRPRMYRLSGLPRSISWSKLQDVLKSIDTESTVGKRDLAMLLLLATYGLRASEVAALTLDSIDWAADRLQVPARKAGHDTTYPLSPVVGEAIVEYLRNGRPASSHRALFLCVTPPCRPVSFAVVSDRAGRWLRNAAIEVRRPGSHTLRHTCVRRLLQANLPLKVIGDYLGHAQPRSTAIYAKIDLESLRKVALSGCGEDVL